MGFPLNRYGLAFQAGTSPIAIERYMLRKGGQWTTPSGKTVGNGMFWHMKHFQELLWPEEKKWHRWNELQLSEFLKNRMLGMMGPASSGKTNAAATDLLADWWIWPECTTTIVSSTTLERLEDRIWGEMKKYFRIAKARWPELSGNLIEGRKRIIYDGRNEASDGRDFRNGILGVPTKRGENYVGLGDYIGIKNKRVRMAADELQLLPSIFIFSASNLDKNPDFKLVGLGNPKDTTDALGTLCEPKTELGGWDSNIDQPDGTKTWETRFGGICIQFDGEDSPNLDGKLGIPLITLEAINRDIQRYGKDSLQFTMMNKGQMPKGQGSRRVITRQICLRNNAMEDPEWLDQNRKKIACLDAAYGGVGGDRCIYQELEFGYESRPLDNGEETFNIANQNAMNNRHRQMIALVKTELVPVNAKLDVPPEEQIVVWVKNRCQAAGIPPEHFFFDSGMRVALVTKFCNLWSPSVNGIDSMGPPTEREVGGGVVDKTDKPILCKDYYFNFITEMWYSSRLIIECGQFRGLTESVMREGCMREWFHTQRNKIQVEPKKDMKDKTGFSPDLYDCLCIGLEGARRIGFVIKWVDKNRPVTPRTPETKWKRDLIARASKQWQEGSLNYSA